MSEVPLFSLPCLQQLLSNKVLSVSVQGAKKKKKKVAKKEEESEEVASRALSLLLLLPYYSQA